MKRYAHFYDGETPDEQIYREWDTSNVQLICGTQTPGLLRIAVVDLDGDEAQEAWKKIVARNPATHHTWIARTGSGGLHIYYRIPPDIDRLPGGVLWGIWDTFGGPPGREARGDWVKHKRIDLMADRSLAVAPPSFHVETGNQYAWLTGRGPKQFSLPALLPRWIVDMPRLQPTNQPPPKEVVYVQGQGKGQTFRPQRWTDSATVIEAIPVAERIALVKAWGLRFATLTPNEDGWMRCRAVGREDNIPSASFNPATGFYFDSRDDAKLGLFDLGAELGAFADWQSCRAWCAEQYLKKGTG